MKHRGRHRRRRRGRALRATLAGTALALTAAATLISASQATVADAPGALKPVAASDEAGRLPLAEHRVPGRWLDRLASKMGRPVGVGAVLEGADLPLRNAADCSTAEKQGLPVEPAATRAYCFGGSDTRGWRAGACRPMRRRRRRSSLRCCAPSTTRARNSSGSRNHRPILPGMACATGCSEPRRAETLPPFLPSLPYRFLEHA